MLQKGSRVSYNYYYKYAPQTDIPKTVNAVRPDLDKEGLDIDTVEERKNNTGKCFRRLQPVFDTDQFYRFVAGMYRRGELGAHLYARKNKFYRHTPLHGCQWLTGLSYLADTDLCIGFIGSVVGAGVGVLIQQLLPAGNKGFFTDRIDYGPFLAIRI